MGTDCGSQPVCLQLLFSFLLNHHTINICLTHIILSIHQPRRSAHNNSWRTLKRARRAKKHPRRCKSIRSGTFDTLHRSSCWPLRRRSFQDALRTFFQPIKNDDPRLDFYAMYKREATEYDTDYVKKYDEDLNTTLIFVRRIFSVLLPSLTCPRRRVCSPRLARPSSSTYIRTSSPIRTSKPQSSFVPSSSPSTTPLSQAKPPPFRLSRKPHPVRSSLSLDSCMRVFCSRCSPPSLRCWASSGSTGICVTQAGQ